MSLGGSKSIYRALIQSLLRAKLSFYDRHGLGRIITRCVVDMNILDDALFDRTVGVLVPIATLLCGLGFQIVVLHWMAVVIVPLG
eukprot:3980396-Prymnesium_polylepis.1